MKQLAVLFLYIAVMICYSGNSFAQAKPKVEITSAKQKDEIVRFTLTSSRPFIFGSNRYVLHIGGKIFFQYEQSKKHGKGIITFLIPAHDYNSLTVGKTIFLTYGDTGEDEDLDALSKQSPRCWPLGKFNKNLRAK